MTTTLESPLMTIGALQDSAEERVPTELVGGAFFADLVRAHYAWERALADGSDPGAIAELGKTYDETLRQFEAVEGKILDSYWCVRRPSAVAVTERHQTRKDRLFGEQEIRLHRLSNWLMPRSAQQLDCLLHECDEFAIKSEEILRGAPKRIALRSIYEVQSSVLAFLERTGGRPSIAEVDDFVTSARKGMRAAHECYTNAADKVARMVYVSGLCAGVAGVLPLALLAAVGLWIFGVLNVASHGTQAFFACLTAGALGAFVSVLSRMSSPAKFDIDPQVGRRAIFYLGAYRPLVGAIFGLAIYFLLKSSLLEVQPKKEFATFVVGAFLGGFSERFLKVMLSSAEQSAGGARSTASTLPVHHPSAPEPSA